MLKVCEISAKALLQDRFPAETADFTIWGVSDPEAPEDLQKPPCHAAAIRKPAAR